MRYLISFLLVLSLFVTLPSAPVHAALSVRKSTATAATSRQHPVLSLLPGHKYIQNDRDLDGNNRHKKAPSESGWEGIVALVCSLCGLPVLGIIFGAIGMGKGHKNRNLAIAGFVIGIVEIVLAVLLVVLIIAAIGASGVYII